MKKELLGTIRLDPKNLTKNKGHEYGAGRGERIHKRPTEKRAKSKLRQELREW